MTQYVVSSGSTQDITLSGGDTMSVFDTGVSENIDVVSGGQELVYSGGVVSGSQLYNQKSSLIVSAGGQDYSVDVRKSATEYVSSGGITYGSNLSGGYERVYAGGVASGTTIGSGGLLALSGGTGYGNAITHGGGELITGGGVESSSALIAADQFLSGGKTVGEYIAGLYTGDGTQLIGEGGVADKSTVETYGVQTVSAGGKAVDTTILYDGEQFVYSGGKTYDTVVEAGGSVSVESGGVALNTTIAGGQVLLVHDARIEGGLDFSGSGGVLSIEGTKMPKKVISGFGPGDQIILEAAAHKGTLLAVVGSPGVVTVSAGYATFTLNIAGAMVGETDFAVTSGRVGVIRTKNASAQMQFLQPQPSSGQKNIFVADGARDVVLDRFTVSISRVVSSGPVYASKESVRPDQGMLLLISATSHLM